MIKRTAILGAGFALLVAGAFAIAQTIETAPAPAEAPSLTPQQGAVVAPWSAPAAQVTPQNTPPAEAPASASAPAPIATPAEPTPAEPQPPADVATPVPATEPAPSDATPLPTPKPTVAVKPDGKDVISAKQLFSAEKLPSLGKAMAIGYYPRGCLQGGVALPVNGPTWQVMRLSRNRNWGHPNLVNFLEKFAPAAAKATGWKGILVGDMAQPRGGPTPTGHVSHQTGLDVDVWFMPMPDHTLSKDEREKTSAINLVGNDWKSVNPKTWTPQHYDFIRVAAQQAGVERVLVNAAIKKEMCRMQGGKHPDWMEKIRPWYAHHDHIHVRMECPADSPNCRKQPSVPENDGCGADLDFWFSDKVLKPKRAPPNPNAKPPRPITLADMPPACRTVLAAPAKLGKSDE